MSSFYQQTITGKHEFRPPPYNVWVFLDHIAHTRPKLLDPRRHSELLIALAHFVGLQPDEWSRDIGPIKWLFEISPDVERACRKYRSNAR